MITIENTVPDKTIYNKLYLLIIILKFNCNLMYK